MFKRKFGNTRYLGHDSKLEYALHQLLELRVKAKELSELKHHPGTVFLTEARIQYRPDFCAVNNVNNSLEYYESKGFENPEWRIKRKLWVFYGPSKLYIYKGTYKRLYLHEVLEPTNIRGELK